MALSVIASPDLQILRPCSDNTSGLREYLGQRVLLMPQNDYHRDSSMSMKYFE